MGREVSQREESTTVLDDAEYDDDWLRCLLRQHAVASPFQYFALAEDATLDSARYPAFPVVTELVVYWALGVEHFAVDQAEQMSPD